MSNQQQTIKAVNQSGNFIFDTTAKVLTNCTSFTINAREENGIGTSRINMEADNESYFRTNTGNLTIEAQSDVLNLFSNMENANGSIYMKAGADGGGIKIESDVGGVLINSVGNVDINSTSADINIGFGLGTDESRTNNIFMDATNLITASAADVAFVASDSISLISLTGDIALGSSLNQNIIKFENDNLLINQLTSTKDYQLDIKLTDGANQGGANGIYIESANSHIASQIVMSQAGGTTALFGLSSANTTATYSKYIDIMQQGTTIIPIGMTNSAGTASFTINDIGRTIYYKTTDVYDTITALGTYIGPASNVNATTNLTTSGTYSGTRDIVVRIEIDSVATPNTYRWYINDAEPRATYVNTSTSPTVLYEGIEIQFTSTVGHTLGDYWTFVARIAATVSTTRTIEWDRIYVIKPYTTYIENSNNTSDILIRPAGINRFNITTQGGMAINSALTVGKKDYLQLINEYNNNFQLNPAIASCGADRGYVAVWESNGGGGDANGYGIWGQLCMNDGEKYGVNFRVNKTTLRNQRFPHVAAGRGTAANSFIITWIGEEAGNAQTYDIYAQIYTNNIAILETDIVIESTTGNQLYPRATGLDGGNFLVVWASDDAANGNYNIYGRIISAGGVLQGARFRVNSANNGYSHIYPYPFALSATDNTVPSGFGVVFLNEYVSNNTNATPITDNNRYNIQYRLFNSNASPYGVDVDITDSTGNSITMTDGNAVATGLREGGFAVSFFRNYGGFASLYSIGDNVESLSTDLAGTIEAITGDNIITISGLTSSDRLEIGEEIIIANNWVERIKKVSHSGGGRATITLDGGQMGLYLYRYATVSSVPQYTLTVNTTPLSEDRQRGNYELFDTESIFPARRAAPSICENGDHIFVSWANGVIPRIYGQLVRTVDGEKYGGELLLSKNVNINQRNPASAAAMTSTDYIMTVWDAEAADVHDSGIYANVVMAPDAGIFNVGGDRLYVGTDGVGVGTTRPNAAIHVKTANTCVITFENTKEDITPHTPIGIVNFMNNTGEVSNIRVEYSANYQKLAANYADLVAYYTFDENSGSNAIRDMSQNRLTGRIENFDVYNCWKKGKIGSALEFNGSNTYAYIPAATQINALARAEDGFSICAWIRVAENITEGNIINQGGREDSTGYYYLKTTSAGEITYGIRSDTDLNEITTIGANIADGGWHYIVGTYSAGNSIQKIYIDGAENYAGAMSGTVSEAENSNVYIGAANATAGYFRGYIDELRLYSKPLAGNDIATLYKYGATATHAAITIGDSITFDGDKITNLRIQGGDYKNISGTVELTEGSNTANGTETAFTREVAAGDVLTYNGNEITVASVIDDITLGLLSNANQNINNTRTSAKPPIMVAYDAVGNNILNIDYAGKFRIGTVNKEQYAQFEICGENPFISMINSGGGSTIWQNGDGTQEYQTIEGSSTALSVNSGMRNIITLRNDGNVGINETTPIAKFHITANYQDKCRIVLKADDYPERVGGEESTLYFVGSNSIGENTGGLAMNALAAIAGASDSSSIDVDGRLDFYTNNTLDEIGLRKRMTITKTGAVCVGAPTTLTKGLLHIAPALVIDDIQATQADTTITLTDNIITDDIINGIIIYGNDSQTTRRIVAKPTNMTLTADRPATITANTSISVHYGGLYVDNRGNVGISTTNPLNRFYVEGPVATTIKTITGDYTITMRDSTILCDASGQSINIVLANMEGNAGRIHTIKKIDTSPNTIIITTTNGAIDGGSSVLLENAYSTMMLQCDGVDWWIIARF